ncbi:MAG: cysteine--tRNA ligase [Oscillospiraceae bacterium]|jgi:cysteinyl-tRNA synthetase|nr:cysteine--tRNA ligase [Oscillospiraceae bacterium]
MIFFNTLSGKKEKFVPLEKNKVKIYVCGPTVYNLIHLGNARPMCVFDVLRKYLIYRGYEVIFVQNFTDIDDKIIKKAEQNKTFFEEVSKKYKKEYIVDARGLGISKPDITPSATDYITEMINFISKLIKKNYAYKTDSGSVYFKTNKFYEYGKLSGQNLSDLKSDVRIFKNEEKKNATDFALWKSSKPNEPSWISPWGKGRPGWHIECSTMIKKNLGDTIDIHCGGEDLIFPHHENEIAQSECCNNKKLANYWLHNGFINIDNKKMSKSLNNFFTVRDLSKKVGYEVLRYLLISVHYRSPINFSEKIIDQCKSSLTRLYNCKNFLEKLSCSCQDTPKKSFGNINKDLKEELTLCKKRFIEAMNNDLNTADALGYLFILTKKINSKIFLNKKVLKSKQTIKFARNIFEELTDILGILYEKKSCKNPQIEIKKLIEERQKLREKKDYKTADKIRKKLDKMGIILKDTADGAVWENK